MKKRFAAFLFIFFLAVIYLQIVVSDENKIEQEVFTELQGQENVRVIIELEEKTNLQEVLNIDTKQDVVDSLDGKVKHEFEESVSAIISEKELLDLENNPDVKSIKFVGTKKIFLSESVPLVNATNTWVVQFDSVNLTGIGETVCILDTGVDFTHSDLTGRNLTCIIDCFSGSGCFENCSAGDDHGHGTHVAGTVAANGVLKGVAPGVNLIGVQVCSSSGSCPDDDVRAGIDWCVTNSSQYNISVISMSLGGGQYDSYCDNVDDSANLTLGINNALAQNISVVVATGNTDGTYTNATAGIASPACIQNSTRVTAADKSDGFASFAFRHQNFPDILVAPGVSINFTYLAGGYAVFSGTSMATPHVSGAFALIKQFKKLEVGRILTPSEIKTFLINYGKNITDSVTGSTFSRIDIYSTILNLDEKSPTVVLVSPENNLSTSPGNVTFNCNVTDELQLSNLTINVWNSSNLFFTNSTNASENSLEVSTNLNLSNGGYSWNCLAHDNEGNQNLSSNYSLTIQSKATTLISPSNNTYTNIANTNLTCSSYTDSNLELINMTLNLWNSSNLNQSETKNISGYVNETTFTINLTSENNYSWDCMALDNSSKSILSENFTLIYDSTPPNLTLIIPEDGNSLTGTSDVTFEYNVSETNLNNCSLILNNETDQTNSSIVRENNEFTSTLSPGTYTWEISCSDLASNNQTSESRTLTINSIVIPSTSSSSGGGGGGSSSTTYSLSEDQIKTGTSKTLKRNDKIRFTSNNEKHTLKVDKISEGEVTITISSNPITLILKIGETRKVNLNNDEYYDLSVSLNSITFSKASFTIKEIHEEISVKKLFEDRSSSEDNVSYVELGKELGAISITGFMIDFLTSNKRPFGFGFIIFIAIAVLFVLRKFFVKKSKSSTMELLRRPIKSKELFSLKYV